EALAGENVPLQHVQFKFAGLAAVVALDLCKIDASVGTQILYYAKIVSTAVTASGTEHMTEGYERLFSNGLNSHCIRAELRHGHPRRKRKALSLYVDRASPDIKVSVWD